MPQASGWLLPAVAADACVAAVLPTSGGDPWMVRAYEYEYVEYASGLHTNVTFLSAALVGCCLPYPLYVPTSPTDIQSSSAGSLYYSS